MLWRSSILVGMNYSAIFISDLISILLYHILNIMSNRQYQPTYAPKFNAWLATFQPFYLVINKTQYQKIFQIQAGFKLRLTQIFTYALASNVIFIKQMGSNLNIIIRFVLMERGILISHRTSQKEFFLSKNTQLHLLTALLKRAFHLTVDIKGLRHPRGYSIPIQDIFNFHSNQPFQLILEEDNSDDRSRSQTFSQKALTKRSGRKFPPQQKQLNQTKLYIDDFQFFMTEVAARKTEIFSGVVFFNNKKSASYLGKKILRQLIYQFDQLMFFYALHPLKKHTSSMLLGQTLNFAIFKGTKLINQRQFPENLHATQQIIGYLKLLVKKGEIPEGGEEIASDKKEVRRNLIQLNEQKSFQAKVQNDLQLDFEPIPCKLEKHQTQLNTKSAISPISKIQSPIKSQLTNEINQISFENDLYQPEWFTEGQYLNRLEKSFLSSLIKSGDQIFISFCHGLDLKNKTKLPLNVELIKVFLKDLINKKLGHFSEEQRYLIELNQQNRQSPVFSLLLKLNKFGNIEDFLASIGKHIQSLVKNKISYVQLARQIQKRRSTGIIKLRNQDDQDQQDQQVKNLKLISKQQHLTLKYNKIADAYHRASSLMVSPSSISTLPNQFNQSQKAMIIASILNKDPFLIENYIPSKWSKKKFSILKPQIVKNFLTQNQKRFGIFRNFPFNENIKKKLQKFEQFNSLLYYLYKQRTISKKQKIGFFYLYIWSDLNILACFELYCLDRNLEDCIQTLYTIDYTYYLEDRYGLDSSQVQNFSTDMEKQLLILFLLSEHIHSIDQKNTMEKYIRAGDTEFLLALQKSNNEQELADNIIKLLQKKQGKLIQIQKQSQTQAKKDEKKKKDMKSFIQSIRPVHFKQLKDLSIVNECIELDEPIIHGIFEVYYASNQVVDWIQSFKIYLQNLTDIHMKTLFKHICNKHNLPYDKLILCRTDLVQGAYQVHIRIKDQAETVETLDKIIAKQTK